ncbi:MAG: hypothetical protein ACI9VI_003495, partial [Candidatus Azotimanducaceae bacterium]
TDIDSHIWCQTIKINLIVITIGYILTTLKIIIHRTLLFNPVNKL